ncbi:MAG: hypothetical protein EXQ95_05745 [Alphaproteobacteria bacterium]|nr:hypothetical protein [Alphaproteobacteria bacterium]
MMARAFALGVAVVSVVGCQDVRHDVRSAAGLSPNPLLQTREGRREIVSLCHDAAQERVASVDSLRFAVGQIANTDDYGDARYHGAVEGVTAGLPRRYAFICTVQPSGALEVVFR